MDNRDELQEGVKEIRASCVTWWWCFIYLLVMTNEKLPGLRGLEYADYISNKGVRLPPIKKGFQVWYAYRNEALVLEIWEM